MFIVVVIDIVFDCYFCFISIGIFIGILFYLKVALLKKLQKNSKYHKAFKALSDDWTLKSEVMENNEAFTCLMYGQDQESLVHVVQAKFIKKWWEKMKVLPSSPRLTWLVFHHVKTYSSCWLYQRLAIYKHADQCTLAK